MARLRIIDDEVIERPFNAKQFQRLLEYFKPYKWRVVLTLCLLVILSLCSLGMPFLMSRALDLIRASATDGLLPIFIAMLTLGITSAICMRYRARVMDTVEIGRAHV